MQVASAIDHCRFLEGNALNFHLYLPVLASLSRLLYTGTGCQTNNGVYVTSCTCTISYISHVQYMYSYSIISYYSPPPRVCSSYALHVQRAAAVRVYTGCCMRFNFQFEFAMYVLDWDCMHWSVYSSVHHTSWRLPDTDSDQPWSTAPEQVSIYRIPVVFQRRKLKGNGYNG